MSAFKRFVAHDTKEQYAHLVGQNGMEIYTLQEFGLSPAMIFFSLTIKIIEQIIVGILAGLFRFLPPEAANHRIADCRMFRVAVSEHRIHLLSISSADCRIQWLMYL